MALSDYSLPSLENIFLSGKISISVSFCLLMVQFSQISAIKKFIINSQAGDENLLLVFNSLYLHKIIFIAATVSIQACWPVDAVI